MRWPIRYQILLPFAGMMLVAVAGVSVLNAYLAARHTEERIDAQVREVARTLLDSNFPLTGAVLADMRAPIQTGVAMNAAQNAAVLN